MSRTKKTGKDWAEKLGLRIINPKGWSNEKQFNSELISKTEFINRASASEVAANFDISRRAAAELLRKI
jgi:hypothetical protein